MKTKISYSLLAAAMACGMAQGAATAYTTPVGYETQTLASGFNYVGLRLQEAVVIAGTFETIGVNTLVDTGVNIQAALTPATTYIVEIVDGPGVGAIAEILGSAAVNDTITATANNFASLGVTSGAKYVIRPASTLSSVFGPANQAGLAPGSFGPGGADVVFVPNGSSFDQYYYDADEVSWSKVATPNPILVDGASVPLVYLDSMIINSTGTGATSLLVDGEVKTKSVVQAPASGFNYLGSVFPVGATLGSSYGGAIASLDQGSFGPGGADIFLIPNGASFDQYYYDADEASWAKVASPNPILVDANTIPLPSGFIFSNEGAPINLKNSAPSAYSSL